MNGSAKTAVGVLLAFATGLAIWKLVSKPKTPEPPPPDGDGGELTLSQPLVSTGWRLYSGYLSAAGGTFNSWPASVISSIQTMLDKHGLPTGIAYIRVRRKSDNSLLGTLGAIDVSTLSPSPSPLGWYTFDSGIAVVPSTEDIRILVEYTGGDSANYVGVWFKASDVYPGGNLCHYLTNYTEYTSYDWTWRNLIYTPSP